tara:strand:+ start:177 stop:575 length:399 start_codon:yes stop_codon:yes gene_type:complete
MALWNVNGELVYSSGSLSITNPPSNLWVTRHTYKVPYSNVGKGGFMMKGGKKFHTPSWIEVHPDTTLDDIQVDKKPFEELFVEPKTWTYESASSNKTYTVKYNKNGNLSCDCWGYIAHRKCKHIKDASEKIA